MDQTLRYYNENALSFFQGTVSVDFGKTRNVFLKKLDPGALILDFGCGAGRDAKAFLEAGFTVEASDGSEELCRMASSLIGIEVSHMLFGELDAVSRYDGIWACASILHLPKNELRPVMGKMARALKPNGVIYTSFKHGTFEGIRNGRHFTDFTAETFREWVSGTSSLRIEDSWVSGDVRPGRENEKWLNLILRRN